MAFSHFIKEIALYDIEYDLNFDKMQKMKMSAKRHATNHNIFGMLLSKLW